MQPGVLCFGLFDDGDVRVGVLPDGEEILVGGFGFGGIVGAPEDSSTAAIDPELLGTPRRDSDSRLSRLRSVRISAALW